MGLIVGDFETYYDKDYSLSKITTQQYILDPRFEVVGVSIKVDDNEPQWFSGTMAETGEWLSQFDWENSMFVAHNCLFDGAILAWKFGIHPKYLFCTMMGSRPFLVPFIEGGRMSLAKVSDYLGIGKKGDEVVHAIGKRRIDFDVYSMSKYAKYCVQDTDLSYKIARHLIPQFPADELKLLDLNLKKYTKPMFVLDFDVLETELATLQLEKAACLRRAGVTDVSKLMSNDQFAASLKLLGVNPPVKISPRTGKETWAFAKTDEGMKQLLDHQRRDVQVLTAARVRAKSTLEETRMIRLMDIHKTGGRFGVPLLYYGAHTGRLSGFDKLNQQNNTKGSAVRRAIVAPEGYSVVAGDLSQIECRILSVLAGQTDLVEAFARGDDVYCKTASSIYNKPITAADVEERFLGKTATLGCGYGVGATKFYNSVLQAGVEITFAESDRIVHVYRQTYKRIPMLWKIANKWLWDMAAGGQTNDVFKCIKIFRNYKGKGPAILLPNGMPMYYPELYIDASKNFYYTKKGKVTKTYGAAVIENVCQALARIIISRIELKVAARGYPASNQVHDELVYVIPNNELDNFKLLLEETMKAEVPWMPELPVDCEIHSGASYADCK